MSQIDVQVVELRPDYSGNPTWGCKVGDKVIGRYDTREQAEQMLLLHKGRNAR